MRSAERTIQEQEPGYAAPTGRFFLVLIAAGGVVGLVLLILDAPFWVFYASSLLVAPFVVWDFRSHAVVASEGHKQEAPARLGGRVVPGWMRLRFFAQGVRNDPLTWLAVALLLMQALVVLGEPGFGSPLGWFGAASLAILVPWIVLRAYSMILDLRRFQFEISERNAKAKWMELNAQRSAAVARLSEAEERLARIEAHRATLKSRRRYGLAARSRRLMSRKIKRPPLSSADVVVYFDGVSWLFARTGEEDEPLARRKDEESILKSAREYLAHMGGGTMLRLNKSGRSHQLVSVASRRRPGLYDDADPVLIEDREFGDNEVAS